MPVVNCQSARFDTYIGRGSRFGNPFPIRTSGGRDQAISLFKQWIQAQPELLRLIRRELGGKLLGCHCAPAACHGDLLDQIALGAWDQYIPQEPIFVFGSNEAGKHGRGAARFAKNYRSAVYGVGKGPTGSCYALPTKDKSLNSLPTSQVLGNLDELFEHAASHGQQQFQLTRIGCGLAGASAEAEAVICDKALEAPTNVLLPGTWLARRDPTLTRVIVAGSRTFKDYDYLKEKLECLLGGLIREGRHIEIVSGGAKGADTLGERYAIERGFGLRRFPAEWERFGKAAGGIRNQHMAWYSTHLVAFWDGLSTGTASMRQIALESRLNTRTVKAPLTLQDVCQPPL